MVCVAAASQPAALFKNERPFSVLFFGESSKGHSGMLPSSCSGGGTHKVLRNQKNSAIAKIIFLRQSTPEMSWNIQKNRLYGDVPTYETGANVHLSCTFHVPTFQHCVPSGSPACPKASTVILVLWCGDDSNAVICLAGRLNWWWWRTRLFGSRRTSAPFSNIGTPPFSLAFCLFQSISGVDWRRNIIFSSEVISSSFSILVYHISVIFIFRKTGVINFTFSYIYLKLTTPTPPPPLYISWFLIVTVLGFCWTRNYQSGKKKRLTKIKG